MVYNNKKYGEKIIENSLPCLKEDERIYFNVPYMARGFAKLSNCRFDSEKKLWYTGLHNSNLSILVELYGVNDVTSNKTKELLKDKLSEQ